MATETDYLIKLLIAQDAVVHSWIKLLFTVEAGMILILGFILRPSDSGVPIDVGLRLAASFGVPFFGIIFAVAIAYLVVLERKWVGWYVQRIKDQALSPTIMPPSGAVSKQPVGKTGYVVISIVIVLILGWIGILVVLKPWTLY